MHALSIRQPWASAIAWGWKDVENRTWPTKYRGPVLIHAGKAWKQAERDDVMFVERTAGWAIDEDLIARRLGGIVARAEIVDCVTEMDSPWFFGPYGFVLSNVEELPFQPCRGALGFFDPKITT